VVAALERQGRRVFAYTRQNWPAPGADLGHVIYCVGMTADFRSRPFDTVDAHVGQARTVLASTRCRSFLYTSSTRIYRGATGTAEETPLSMAPTDPDRLYDLTKLAGECLTLAQPKATFRVARIANLYGPGQRSQNFLSAILGEAARTGQLTLRQGLNSTKDYIAVADVAKALVGIALQGRHRIYNVSSGQATRHGAIASLLSDRFGIPVTVADGATDDLQPAIDNTRLTDEFGVVPASVLDDIPGLLDERRLAHAQELTQ
jgi:nucleoside-diphosphate-sugar epimerase